ncbi:MAG: orotidine-5'-phosphate decarboxylase, partial [Euryarchaeota archaeon]|nr:orotidine-5'-phosphate decarboxylase [Euryarchaeota archaeon]
MKRNTGLVVALDVETEARALRVARETRGLCDGLKVGVPLLLEAGTGVLRRLRRHGYVLADMKVADVPHTNRATAEHIFRAGAQGLIVHGFCGPDSLRACVGAARRHRGEVYVVAEMSHPGGKRFTAPAAEAIARMARREGAHGLVAPATRPPRIRLLSRASGLPLLCPGVGAQG